MKILESAHRTITGWFIESSDQTTEKGVRIQYGMLAGWFSISAILLLFVLKMALGLISGSISVVADAFHLLSHLANSVILVVSFWVASRPATAKTPFGHGRMEYVAPLVMSVFLFVSGIEIGEISVHRVLESHEIHYWPALPWILLATIIVKAWMGQFVRFLGERVASHAILANAAHQNIDAVISLAVIAGLVSGHYLHLHWMDGAIGVLVSIWLLYMGFRHGKNAVIPLLGEAPSRKMTEQIREIAKSVRGVEDVHEIIVHDYGSLYMISLHVEIPERLGPANIHEVTERCEHSLRKKFAGEVVCHADPLMEKTPEIEAIEAQFRTLVGEDPKIVGYHGFRVVAESEKMRIIVADIDADETVPEREFDALAAELDARIKAQISNVAYCNFYVTPKFSY